MPDSDRRSLNEGGQGQADVRLDAARAVERMWMVFMVLMGPSGQTDERGSRKEVLVLSSYRTICRFG